MRKGGLEKGKSPQKVELQIPSEGGEGAMPSREERERGLFFDF
jgi:hypothetical protein